MSAKLFFTFIVMLVFFVGVEANEYVFAEPEEENINFFLDKAWYHPRDNIHIKGWVNTVNSTEIQIEIINPESLVIVHQRIALQEIHEIDHSIATFAEEWNEAGFYQIRVSHSDETETRLFAFGNFDPRGFEPEITLGKETYSWTDTVKIMIVSPNDNKNNNQIDKIKIEISSSTGALQSYVLEETGVSHGIFSGIVTLTGHSDFDLNQDGRLGDVRGHTGGVGPDEGDLSVYPNDTIKVVYSTPFYKEKVEETALIQFQIATVQWVDLPIYSDQKAFVRVIDPDMRLWPEFTDDIKVLVKSFSLKNSKQYVLKETKINSGIFEGKIQLDSESTGSGVFAPAGSIVSITYEDTTLPSSFLVKKLNIIANATVTGPIKSERTPLPPVLPQMISEKYVNSDVGLEMEFPKKMAGFEITFPKDMDYSQLPAELRDMAEIYSGMTMLMMLPVELDPTGNIEMIMLTIMETSSIETFSEIISQTVESAASQSSGDTQDIESLPECDISNQTILEINEMKAIQINSECYDPTEDMAITMSMYMFMTEEYVISPMYMITHEPDKQSDLSVFEDSLSTLKIENTIDISDPNSYVELFGLEITQEKIMIENKSHEIEIVSDSPITNFSFDENNKKISFELQENKDATLGSTEIYLGNALNAPYTVTIDSNVDDTFMITEDKTTGQTSIGISYMHPVDKITVSGIYESENSPSTQDVSNVKSQIPDWIRTSASWWVQGNIDDKAFVGGIQYLIKEGIIQIPETTKSSELTGSQEIPGWIKNNADWWSQGLISDGDFLKGIQFMVENGIIVV